MERHINLHAEEVEKVLWMPLLEQIFRETKSGIILEEDASSIQVKLVCGQLVWLRYRLRDRRFDGPGCQPTPLVDWHYDKENDMFSDGSALEESSYFLDPRQQLERQFGKDWGQFVKNPFGELEKIKYLEECKEWLIIWFYACYSSNVFPGYFTLKNIPRLRAHIFEAVTKLAREKGYDYLTAVPTWWHVAGIYEAFRFGYRFKEDKLAIGKIRSVFLKAGIVDRRVASWIVMLQFWAQLVADKFGVEPEELVREEADKQEKIKVENAASLILRDENRSILTFPLTPERNLWMESVL